jgi:Peptidase inhibitor I78 family.
VPQLKETICALTGRTRVVGPNEMCTREYDVERIQIKAGADLLIQGFDFN